MERDSRRGPIGPQLPVPAAFDRTEDFNDGQIFLPLDPILGVIARSGAV